MSFEGRFAGKAVVVTGAAPAPGVVAGSSKKDGHSPPGKPGCLPILYHVLKSMLP